MKHVLAFFLLLIAGTLVHAAPRVALVIGNNAYRDLSPSMQLTSPAHDAADVAAALQRLGYTLVGDAAVVDATREKITAATEQFATAARGAEAAVFYFSGHGIQVGEDNYLLPSDTPKLTGLSMLKNRAVLLRDSVMVALEEAGAASKVIILDCCRDNPFSAQLETALAQVGKSVKTKSVGEITGYGPGFYLAFATSPGSTAADGNGERNSPFTTAFLKALPGGAGKDIDFFFRDVKALLPDDQVSWTNHSIKGSFALVPGTNPLAGVPMPPSPPAALATAVNPLLGVSKEAPYQNSLGMGFVPAGTPGVLFSVWETRVKDFETFVEDSGHDAINNNAFGEPAFTLESGGEWNQAGGSWRDPRFPAKQSGEHPVVCVSYLDAEAFCAWLTKKDRASGKIPEGASYRLPSDSEWSRACGGSEFPWGDNYPPTGSDGNYAGVEAMVGAIQGGSRELSQAGFRDGAVRTSAVGMFRENRFGLYDMGGNAYEWCSTWYTADLNDAETLKEVVPAIKEYGGGRACRVLRGGSWFSVARGDQRSSFRRFQRPVFRFSAFGFRCVLVVAGGAPSEPGISEAEIEKRARELATKMAAEAAMRNTTSPSIPTSSPLPGGGKSFTNSLGMKFVPVPGTKVMLCIHETRNADYAAYAAAQSGVDESWRREAGAGNEQHPVVYVSYEDAEGFCRWLSAKEGKTYRLPTDAEWSVAVGLENEKGGSPEEKEKNGAKNVYPWGTASLQVKGGNYHGAVDDFDGSAPVMSFRPNPLGIYDLGGNVAEWCQDWHNAQNIYRVQRGASHGHDPESFGYSCCRVGVPSVYRSDSGGFRCVLMADSEGHTSAAVGPNWIVNVAPSDTLSIRSGPSIDYPVLARLSANRKVMLSGDSVKNGTIEWVKIILPGGQIGWAAKKFVSIAATPPSVKTDFEKGTVITFPNGQIFTLEPGKGLLGPSSDPGSQIPFTNADVSIVALNEQPGRQMSFIHIYIKGKDGRFTEVMDVNDSILDAGPQLKNRIPSEFIRLERIDGNLLDVTTVDLSSDTNKEITFRIKVSSNGKIGIVP